MKTLRNSLILGALFLSITALGSEKAGNGRSGVGSSGGRSGGHVGGFVGGFEKGRSGGAGNGNVGGVGIRGNLTGGIERG